MMYLRYPRRATNGLRDPSLPGRAYLREAYGTSIWRMVPSVGDDDDGGYVYLCGYLLKGGR